MRALISEGFPPTSHFSIENIPDLTGKVVIVTGGYTGVGKETVFALLRRHAVVYIAGRSQAKADVAVEDLKERTGQQANFIELDLASLHSVRKAVEAFLRCVRELHLSLDSGLLNKS